MAVTDSRPRLLFPISLLLLLFFFPFQSSSSSSSSSSIYDVLKRHALPTGLLPKGITNFTLDDDSGKFEVHLDRPCNVIFENEFHYDLNISGVVGIGQIHSLSGISAKDLFLWLPVIAIRVDIPSSGLIYFNVNLVSKQFSLSSFESPRDCLAAPPTRIRSGKLLVNYGKTAL